MARTGIWKGSLSFGLINIPVNLQTAEEAKDLHFSMLDKNDLAPIKYRKVNGNSGREVPYDRIVKGYEYDKGQFVIMDKKDFTAANPKATQTMDIEDFVSIDEIDTMLFDKPYYLVPQKAGEKGYFLLRDSLKKSRKVAIGKIVIRTKQHLAAVLVREEYLVLEILRFAHEIKTTKKAKYLSGITDKGKYSAKELKMAEQLIDGMTDKWEPEKYKDTYYDDIMKRINRKIKAGKGQTISDDDDEEEDYTPPKNGKIVDLLPLLRQSLAAKKGGARKRKAKTKKHA